MQPKLSTVAGLSLAVWAVLSFDTHWLAGESTHMSWPRLMTRAAAAELPMCDAEDVRARFSAGINAQRSQELAVTTWANPRQQNNPGTRLCIATVRGPLESTNLLFVILPDPNDPGEWVIELMRY